MRWLFAILNITLIVLQSIALLCALAQPAQAYVDPGAGLLAIQMGIATFAGFVFLLRRRVGRFFKCLTRHQTEKSDKGC